LRTFAPPRPTDESAEEDDTPSLVELADKTAALVVADLDAFSHGGPAVDWVVRWDLFSLWGEFLQKGTGFVFYREEETCVFTLG
jgi:hypothetical protein